MIIVIPLEPESYKKLTYPSIEKDRYWISNYGNIYDCKLDLHKKNTVHKQNGYVVAKMKYQCGRRAMTMVHRLVAWEFCPNYSEERNIVNHKDSETTNLYYENLEWVTISENNKHRFEHGRGTTSPPPINRGEDSPTHLYKETDVHEVCQLFVDGKTLNEIMKQKGYSKNSDNRSYYYFIFDIKRRKTWSHITNEYTF